MNTSGIWYSVNDRLSTLSRIASKNITYDPFFEQEIEMQEVHDMKQSFRCPYCNRKYKPDAEICTGCGAPV